MRVSKCITPFLGCVAVLTVSGANADQLADIKASGVLVCGVLQTLEPFGYLDQNTRQAAGYDIDFCKAVAKDLGVKAEIKPLSLEARILELQQGRVNILAASLGYTPERAKQISYSSGYYISFHKLAVASTSGINTISDAADKRISFAKGGITETFTRKTLPNARLVGFEDTPTAFTALVQRKVKAFSVPEVVAKRFLDKLGDGASNYRIIDPPLGRETWGLGVNKDEPALLSAVNQSLKKMEESGEAQQIFDKWLGQNTIYKMQRSFEIEPIKG